VRWSCVADSLGSRCAPTRPYRSVRSLYAPIARRDDRVRLPPPGEVIRASALGAWGRCSCAGCSGGPTPPCLLAFRRPPSSSPVVFALPRSSSSAPRTSPLRGVSLLHFSAPWRQPLALLRSVASASCTSPLLGVSLVLSVGFVLCQVPFSSAFSDTVYALPSVRFYRQ
jgi:hypothetical protein